MWRYYYGSPTFMHAGWSGLGFGLLLSSLIVWSLVWKGLALWRAGRTNDKAWFVALLLLNTLGILEMLYLYVFSKPEKK